MRVLHLNTFDIEGGAARAAWRLHQGLVANGVDSLMLVQTKTSGAASVLERDTPLARALAPCRPYAERLPLLAYPGRPATHWATEWLATRINRQIAQLKPDIIHLHWVCRGFMSLQDIGLLAQHTPARVVWTLHDSWAFTGGCHVPGSCTLFRKQCGKCPQLNSTREDDLSRWIWEQKDQHWPKTPITVVTPSRWLAECARSSSLFRERPIEVIPNGIDTALYRPASREAARDAHSLPRDKKLILISAMNATLDANKGFAALEAALRQLSTAGWRDRVELLVAGQCAPPTPVNAGVPVRFLGVIKDEHSMATVYAAADVTVMTSKQENLPNAVMESMACGTPVVAFAIGGLPQMVDEGVTGLLAPPDDSTALATALTTLLATDARRVEMGRASRLKVEREFEAGHITQRYQELYASL